MLGQMQIQEQGADGKARNFPMESELFKRYYQCNQMERKQCIWIRPLFMLYKQCPVTGSHNEYSVLKYIGKRPNVLRLWQSNKKSEDCHIDL